MGNPDYAPDFIILDDGLKIKEYKNDLNRTTKCIYLFSNKVKTL